MKDEMTPDDAASISGMEIERAAASAGATARLLGTGRVISAANGVAVLVAAGQLMLAALAPDLTAPARAWGWWGIAAAGVPACWYAWRVRFDQGLFEDLATSMRCRRCRPETSLADLDAALAALGLAATDLLGARPLADRVRGARGLLVRQGAIAVAQILVALALLAPRDLQLG